MSAAMPESGIEALAILYEQAKSRLLAAEARVREVEAERVEMKDNYERACQTIAEMHAAAMGEVTGPRRGVVEDVADVRAERDALLIEGEQATRLWQAEIDEVSAEREALVPLARYAAPVWVDAGMMNDTLRAILAREEP